MDWDRALKLFLNMTDVRKAWLIEMLKLEGTEVSLQSKLKRTINKVFRWRR